MFFFLFSLRYFEYIKKHHPVKIEEARATLQSHFKGINKLVNESMILLYKLPDVARRFQLDLPDWIPKHPALVSLKERVRRSIHAKALVILCENVLDDFLPKISVFIL